MTNQPKVIGTACMICSGPIPQLDGRTWRRKTCSDECKAAYRRQQWAERPKSPKPRPSLHTRFWSKVAKGEPGECWEWQGATGQSGHGQFWTGERITNAHRMAYRLTKGEIPDGLMVRHACDNPPCCNPSHLLVGTARDNSQDALERGRTARSGSLPQTRLSDAEVAEIRASYETFTIPGRRGLHSNADVLAAAHGVTRQYIQQVAQGHYRKAISA